MRETLFTVLQLLLLLPTMALSQNIPVVLELEDGSVGADFSIEEEGNISYVTIMSNGTAGNPEQTERIIQMEVTFPAAQTYDLYIRYRVGSGGANDDSFFYGNGFGQKNPTMDADWIRVNNIHGNGYTDANNVVDGGGSAGYEVWKWLNLSAYTGDESPVNFVVGADALTQTIEIGAREDGLDIDKIAFARSGYYFTVANLEEGTAGSADPPNDDDCPDTEPVAAGKAKFLGSAYSQSQADCFASYWNQVTPENGGKWGSVEFTRDNMVWTEADAAYALARENGFPFKWHVLVWGNQQPSWIENLPAEEQLEEIKEWYQAIADRYPDIDYIEVVNEPLHDPPNQAGSGGGNYINALGGTGTTGWDWILEAFRLAREYFPNAELMLNDYSIINSNASTTDYLEIIGLLQAEELIDQIGIQGHAFSTRNASISMIQNNLDRLAATGLPIYVTELDIDGTADQVQLEEYQRIFPIFWEHPAVKGVTLWGYRPGMWRTEQGAFLIENDGSTERPALVWLRGYVESTVVGVREILGNPDRVSIYPNPLKNGALKIEGMDDIHHLQLFDLAGRLVQDMKLNGDQVSLEHDLTPGIYLLKLSDGRQVYTKKLIVE